MCITLSIILCADEDLGHSHPAGIVPAIIIPQSKSRTGYMTDHSDIAEGQVKGKAGWGGVVSSASAPWGVGEQYCEQ